MTFLIIGNDLDVIKNELSLMIHERIENLDVKNLEECVHPDVHLLNGYEQESIGIADIRAFTRILHKKPFKAPLHLGIILGFEKTTPEAQNAMLKELEDHPKTVHYILAVVDENSLLPTIRSRATVKYLGGSLQGIKERELSETLSYFTEANTDILQGYAHIQKKEWTRQSAETFLSELYIHLQKGSDTQSKLQLLQKCSEYLRSNVSPKQVLTYLLFGFSDKI